MPLRKKKYLSCRKRRNRNRNRNRKRIRKIKTKRNRKIKQYGGRSLDEKINALVELFKSKDIQLLIFDWDRTISKQHMFRENIGTVGGPLISVVEDDMSNYFHMLEGNVESVFVKFVEALKKNNIQVAIASFGRCSVMGDALDILFYSRYNRIKHIPNKLILGGDYDDHSRYCPEPYGRARGKGTHKNNQIAEISEKTGVPLQNILFIDDTKRNLTNSNVHYVYFIKPDTNDEYGFGEEQIEKMYDVIRSYGSREAPPVVPPRRADTPPIPPRRDPRDPLPDIPPRRRRNPDDPLPPIPPRRRRRRDPHDPLPAIPKPSITPLTPPDTPPQRRRITTMKRSKAFRGKKRTKRKI